MTGDPAAALRASIQHFVRQFGLLEGGDRTPCGKHLPVSHAQALQVLLGAADPPTQADLGGVLGIDKSNVARLCARLEASGHLSQERCPEDARARRLRLTAKGRRFAAEVDEASRARFATMLAAIPEERREETIRALRLLGEAASKARVG
ncbi:MarR family winged helix-turn-helix transcriptional regulator [Vulgatibacter sp.]|uniref:MarR family winged helix-turn-helix transcriptional regulator n=1 Tax=Vulgatibacter sp. TaxID=1971226 RepID=UPI0035619E86